MTDDLTAGLQVNGVTTEDPIDCTESPTSISCVIAALNPGEKVSFILEVHVDEGLYGPFLNTVEAAAEGDQDAENNSWGQRRPGGRGPEAPPTLKSGMWNLRRGTWNSLLLGQEPEDQE